MFNMFDNFFYFSFFEEQKFVNVIFLTCGQKTSPGLSDRCRELLRKFRYQQVQPIPLCPKNRRYLGRLLFLVITFVHGHFNLYVTNSCNEFAFDIKHNCKDILRPICIKIEKRF